MVFGKVIRKTCPCNVYPLEPHFYIAKLGYAGVYLFFLFLLQNKDCGYSLEPPRRQYHPKNKSKISLISMLYLIHFANGSRGPLQERFNGIIDHSDLGLFDLYQFRRQKDGPSSFAPLLVWTTVKIIWSIRTFCIRQFGPFRPVPDPD